MKIRLEDGYADVNMYLYLKKLKEPWETSNLIFYKKDGYHYLANITDFRHVGYQEDIIDGNIYYVSNISKSNTFADLVKNTQKILKKSQLAKSSFLLKCLEKEADIDEVQEFMKHLVSICERIEVTLEDMDYLEVIRQTGHLAKVIDRGDSNETK